MADPTTVYLTLEAVVALIKLITSLLERSASSKESEFRTNLEIVKVDLGIVIEVLKVVDKKKKYPKKLPEGIKAWKEAAENVVRDTQKLLKRIDENKSFPESDQTADPAITNCWLCCDKTTHPSSKDAQDLKSLKERLDNITKHHQTVRALLKRDSRCVVL